MERKNRNEDKEEDASEGIITSLFFFSLNGVTSATGQYWKIDPKDEERKSI